MYGASDKTENANIYILLAGFQIFHFKLKLYLLHITLIDLNTLFI